MYNNYNSNVLIVLSLTCQEVYKFETYIMAY